MLLDYIEKQKWVKFQPVIYKGCHFSTVFVFSMACLFRIQRRDGTWLHFQRGTVFNVTSAYETSNYRFDTQYIRYIKVHYTAWLSCYILTTFCILLLFIIRRRKMQSRKCSTAIRLYSELWYTGVHLQPGDLCIRNRETGDMQAVMHIWN